MLVSVIVPIYNREEELEKCILSIINQSYKSLEIILVDDGSTDSSLDICQKYAAIDKRIVIIHKENGGLVSARKAGIQKAGGVYVAPVDGDDWIEKEYIETLVHATDSGKVDVIIDGVFYEYIDGSTEKVCSARPCGLYDKEAMKKDIYPLMLKGTRDGYNEIHPSQIGKLFRRELVLEKQMLVDSRQKCDEDTACVYPVLLSAESIRIIDACQYHYVKREGSISSSGTGAIAYFDAVKFVHKRLKEEFMQYEEKEQLLLQLEQLVSQRIAIGMKKYYSVLINQYIFPYGLVAQGAKVVLYGAGGVGRCFYRQLMKDKYCEIISWVDKNYQTVDISYVEVKAPQIILQEKYDYVVVCLQNRKSAQTVISNLKSMGVAEEKIIWKEDYKADMDIRFDG